MIMFTTTDKIKQGTWILDTVDHSPGNFIDWIGTDSPTIKDVDLWEVVFYEPGLVGVYAACCPYVELYAVVNCLQSHDAAGWKCFSGKDAAVATQEYVTQFGITLQETRDWVKF